MTQALIPFLLAVLVSSCSASLPRKKEPQKAPPNVEQDLRSAESALRTGKEKQAMARLKKIVQLGPESDAADDANFMMGQVQYNNHQYAEALASFNAILNSPVASPLETDATLKVARIHLKLSQPQEAERLLETRAARWRSVTPEQALELERVRYETYAALKKNLPALDALAYLMEKHPQPQEREKFKSAGQDLLERLTEDELRQVAEGRKYDFILPAAKFRYALVLADQRQYGRARRLLGEVAELAPGSELAERATNLSSQIDSRYRVDPRTIGVVLPLTGKQAGIGYKALRGIQLGLGIYGKSPSQFRLAVVDSEGNPDTARRAVEKLVQEDNAIAIIGGLLSKTASTEAAKAQEFGVPAIMLAQKAGITQTGDFVFRNALTSQMQIQYIVDLAVSRMGYRNFAILYPNDAYGVEYANLFWDEVRSRGGAITGAQPYDPQETDFRGHVQRLAGMYYLEDRAEEYRLRSKAWAEKNPKRSARQSPPAIEELLPPIVDFDAVFIPDSARAVGQIAPMLAYNNIQGVRLIGTNLWNSPGLVTRGQRFVENSIFADSFLSTDPTFLNSDFFLNFKATFEEEPGLTEVQAYDSAVILRQLIAGGERTRTSLQSRMASLQNFPGAIGRLSVTEDREFRRPLTALTVKDGKISNLETIKR